MTSWFISQSSVTELCPPGKVSEHSCVFLSFQSMRPVGCPPMMGDFTIIWDTVPQFADLEIEMQKVAGEELMLNSPQTYFASNVLFFKHKSLL